jgi:hypothetical protein
MSTRSDGMPSFVTSSLSRREEAPRSSSPRQPTPPWVRGQPVRTVPGYAEGPEAMSGLIDVAYSRLNRF